jgi:hypothetical protein
MTVYQLPLFLITFVHEDFIGCVIILLCTNCIIIICITNNAGHAAGGVVVEALRYKPEGRGIDSRWCQLEFFIDIILPAVLWPWG